MKFKARTSDVSGTHRDRAIGVRKDGSLSILLEYGKIVIHTRVNVAKVLQLPPGDEITHGGTVIACQYAPRYGQTDELYFHYVGQYININDTRIFVTRQGLRAAARRAGVKI